MKTILLLLFVFSYAQWSCNKPEDSPAPFSEATYSLTLTGQWASPELGVPAGVHFTTFLGMIHNDAASIWKAGAVASPGTEMLAETGNGTVMLAEIDSLIKTQNASAILLFTAPSPTGTKTSSLYCNTNYHRVSFASMLGDTPDWFTGLSGVSLYRDNKWISDTTIRLFVYDAGTEEGMAFSSNNPESSPRQAIHLLTAAEAPVLANGRTAIAPIATVRFTKQ